MAAIDNAKPKSVRVIEGTLPEGLTVSVVAETTITGDKTGELRISGTPTKFTTENVNVVLEVEAFNGTTATYTLLIVMDEGILQIYLKPTSGAINTKVGTAFDVALSEVTAIEPVDGTFSIDLNSFTDTVSTGDRVNKNITGFHNGVVQSIVVTSGDLPTGLGISSAPSGANAGNIQLVGISVEDTANKVASVVVVSDNGTANLELDLSSATSGLRIIPDSNVISTTTNDTLDYNVYTYEGGLIDRITALNGLPAGLTVSLDKANSAIKIEGQATAVTKFPSQVFTFDAIAGTKRYPLSLILTVERSQFYWAEGGALVVPAGGAEASFDSTYAVAGLAGDDTPTVTLIGAPAGLTVNPQPQDGGWMPVHLTANNVAEGFYQFTLHAELGEEVIEIDMFVIASNESWNLDRFGIELLANQVIPPTEVTFLSASNHVVTGTKGNVEGLSFSISPTASNGDQLLVAVNPMQPEQSGYTMVYGTSEEGNWAATGPVYLRAVNSVIIHEDLSSGIELLAGQQVSALLATFKNEGSIPNQAYFVDAEGNRQDRSPFPGTEFYFKTVDDPVICAELWLIGKTELPDYFEGIIAVSTDMLSTNFPLGWAQLDASISVDIRGKLNLIPTSTTYTAKVGDGNVEGRLISLAKVTLPFAGTPHADISRITYSANPFEVVWTNEGLEWTLSVRTPLSAEYIDGRVFVTFGGMWGYFDVKWKYNTIPSNFTPRVQSVADPESVANVKTNPFTVVGWTGSLARQSYNNKQILGAFDYQIGDVSEPDSITGGVSTYRPNIPVLLEGKPKTGWGVLTCRPNAEANSSGDPYGESDLFIRWGNQQAVAGSLNVADGSLLSGGEGDEASAEVGTYTYTEGGQPYKWRITNSPASDLMNLDIFEDGGVYQVWVNLNDMCEPGAYPVEMEVESVTGQLSTATITVTVNGPSLANPDLLIASTYERNDGYMENAHGVDCVGNFFVLSNEEMVTSVTSREGFKCRAVVMNPTYPNFFKSWVVQYGLPKGETVDDVLTIRGSRGSVLTVVLNNITNNL